MPNTTEPKKIVAANLYISCIQDKPRIGKNSQRSRIQSPARWAAGGDPCTQWSVKERREMPQRHFTNFNLSERSAVLASIVRSNYRDDDVYSAILLRLKRYLDGED